MDCLKNYIGIRGTGNPVYENPGSGFYVNSLPGMMLNNIQKLTKTSDSEDFDQLWDDIQIRAIAAIESQFIAASNKYILHNLVKGVFELDYYRTPYQSIAATSNLRGKIITLQNSRFMALTLQKVRLYNALEDAVDTTLYVYDVYDGKILYQKGITVNPGHNDIEISNTFLERHDRNKLFICYDATNLDTIATVNSTYYGDYTASSAVPYFYSTFFNYQSAEIPIGQTINESNLVTSSDGFGLSLEFTMGCSVKAFICSIKDQIKTPLWYQYGLEIISEKLNTTRINPYTAMNNKQAEGLFNLYSKMSSDSFSSVVENIVFPSDPCFECNGSSKYSYIKL